MLVLGKAPGESRLAAAPTDPNTEGTMTTRNSARLFAAVALLLGAWQAQTTISQEKKPAESTGPKASIDDLKWIAGQWQGRAMGGRFEETWNPPTAGTMVGVFKFSKGGEVKFHELLTVVPAGDSLLLRLKHFGKDLAGWEDKEKSLEFPLVAIGEGEAKFEGLTFRKVGDDGMRIVVTDRDGDRPRELVFDCRRSKPDHSSAKRAIVRVFEIDKVLAKQRDHLPEKETLAVAVRSYVLGLDHLDFAGCPAEFVASFKKHRAAWNDSAEFFEAHDDLHGEMHDLFDRIRKMDKPVRDELERHYRAIMGTWKPVEAAAKKYGVE